MKNVCDAVASEAKPLVDLTWEDDKMKMTNSGELVARGLLGSSWWPPQSSNFHRIFWERKRGKLNLALGKFNDSFLTEFFVGTDEKTLPFPIFLEMETSKNGKFISMERESRCFEIHLRFW